MNKPMTKPNFIAQRELLFSKKGEAGRSKVIVRIAAPYPVRRTADGTQLDEGAAACEIAFEGLGIESIEVHGADMVHALAQAVDIDVYLRGFAKKFDFYWPSGEPYFDE
jgi:hypothetical protein